MKYLFICVTAIFCFSTEALFSQPPCAPSTKSYFYEMENLQTMPPFSTEMPLETLIGYIAADSVCRNLDPSQMKDFMRRQNNNDTLRYIMKYFYWMTDYNPLILTQYKTFHYPNRMPANFIISELINRVDLNLPISTKLLIQSYYILHVRVNDTIKVNNVQGVICNDMTVVSTMVLGTIKGQVIPVININPTNSVKYEDLKLQSSSVNLIFNFCNQWKRDETFPMNDGNGYAWLQPNTEYIVFLYPIMLCKDSSYFYLTIFPSGDETLSFGMYPIINGNVQDLGNDFGLGTSVPVTIFKQHLQSLIDQIKNYGN